MTDGGHNYNTIMHIQTLY